MLENLLDNPVLKPLLTRKLKNYFEDSNTKLITIQFVNDELVFNSYDQQQKVIPMTDFLTMVNSLAHGND